jgi:hypothetical protein
VAWFDRDASPNCAIVAASAALWVKVQGVGFSHVKNMDASPNCALVIAKAALRFSLLMWFSLWMHRPTAPW